MAGNTGIYLSNKILSGSQNDIFCTNVTNLTEQEWVRAVQSQDEKITTILEILYSKKRASNKNYFDNFAVKNDILYRKCENGKLKWVVPKHSRWLICKLNHDDCGHLGYEKTLSRIKEYYWFPQMSRFLRKYINSCLNCLYMKNVKGPQQGLLNPIPKSQIPFETIWVHLFPQKREIPTCLF